MLYGVWAREHVWLRTSVTRYMARTSYDTLQHTTMGRRCLRYADRRRADRHSSCASHRIGRLRATI
jgi:hypothetical protein